MNFMSKGLARRNISAPILPMPSEPRVRPTRPDTHMVRARVEACAAARGSAGP